MRLRHAFAGQAQDSIGRDLLEFRQGRPDPKKPGKRLALAVKPTEVDGVSVYRSADETIVVAFGADGRAKHPDAGDVTLLDPKAGFVAAVGGKAAPAPKKSGRGANVKVDAPAGYAFAWASDGAEGMKPGGAGGDGGQASATGGVGSHAHSGGGGPGASG